MHLADIFYPKRLIFVSYQLNQGHCHLEQLSALLKGTTAAAVTPHFSMKKCEKAN